MAPKIGVMELYADAENIYNEASLAKYCNASVTIYTTSFLHDRVLPFFKNDLDDYNWIIQQKEETLLSFLKRIEKHCNNEIDLLLMNSFDLLPHHQALYYLFRPKCKVVHVAGRIEKFFGEWHPIRYLPIKRFILSILFNIANLSQTEHSQSLTAYGLKIMTPIIMLFPQAIRKRSLVCLFNFTLERFNIMNIVIN